MVWKPHVTVAAVARQSDRFLLVEEQIEGRLCLNQPAGHLEDGESLLAAVRRETLEETGWEFTPTGLVAVYRWRSDEGETFVRFTFAGTCDTHHPERPLDAEIVQALWLTRTELEARAAELRSPLVMRSIDDAMGQPPHSLDLVADLHDPA